MPKPCLEKNSSIYPIAEKTRIFIPSPKGISTKVNVTARPKFELAYFEATVQRVNHYSTKTPRPILNENYLLETVLRCSS